MRKFTPERKEELEFMIRVGIPLHIIDADSYRFLVKELEVNSVDDKTCIDDFYSVTDLIQAGVMHVDAVTRKVLRERLKNKFAPEMFADDEMFEEIFEKLRELTPPSQVEVKKEIKVVDDSANKTITIPKGEIINLSMDDETAEEIVKLYEEGY